MATDVLSRLRAAACGRPPSGQPQAVMAVRGTIPTVTGLLCGLVGLVDLISAITPVQRVRLRALTELVPGPLTSASAAATLVVGLLLVLLARGLRRRKRRAWRGVVVLLAASVVLNLVKGLDIEESVVAFVLLVALLLTRGEFRAKADPRSRWSALVVGAGLVIVSVAVGVLLAEQQERHLMVGASLAAEVQYALLGLVGVPGHLEFATRHSRDVVDYGLRALGVLTVVCTAYLALRPREPAGRLTTEDERRLRELLTHHGARDSLGYFALRRDKSALWSPSCKAAITYRVVSGVMLASGDPIGDPEAWPGAITCFLEVAAEHAWVPAVMGCSERGGEAWGRAGLSALEIGDEAIVEGAEFSLEGRAMRGVRQAVGRIERAGYTGTARRVVDLGEAELVQLRGRADAWREGATERGFSMALSRIGDRADDRCVVVTAWREGELKGFLHFVPWGTDGLSLDLMRRDRKADNGLNEFLIVTALRAGPALGVCRLSLNFAVFRSSLERGERLGAGPVLRAWRGLLLFASRWFQIESLFRFNAKFRPVWEPRFVCFPATRDLPRIAIAALEAEAFLVRPRLPRRLSRLVHGDEHAVGPPPVPHRG